MDFCPLVTSIITFLHSSESLVWAAVQFLWVWLYYSSNHLPPVVPVPGSPMLSWRHICFKPLYLLGPVIVCGRFAKPNLSKIHLSKGFLRHKQLGRISTTRAGNLLECQCHLQWHHKKTLKKFPRISSFVIISLNFISEQGNYGQSQMSQAVLQRTHQYDWKNRSPRAQFRSTPWNILTPKAW